MTTFYNATNAIGLAILSKSVNNKKPSVADAIQKTANTHATKRKPPV